jgi:hypothetical protein
LWGLFWLLLFFHQQKPVSASDANITEPSPHNLIANMVAMLEAKIFTKLLPNKIVPIKESKSSNKHSLNDGD